MTSEKFAAQLAKEMRTLGVKFNIPNAEKFVAALSKSMNEGLSRDRKLIVSNFGSFEVVRFGAKIIVSPRGDNKKFFMPPTDVIKWHPSGKIRERAGSMEVPLEEYQKLIGNAAFEDESEAVLEPKTEIVIPASPAVKANPYDVKVTFIGKARSHLSDNNSPVSKFVRSLLRLMQTLGADKLEIVPEKSRTQLLYCLGSAIKSQRTIPKDSHKVIIDKIKLLAGTSDELLLFGNDRIKLKKQLTPFGDQLIITRI